MTFVDSEKKVMKSEDIVRVEIHWNMCSFVTTFTDMLKSIKTKTCPTPLKKV